MQQVRFPAVEGEALDGTRFAAPADFAGARTVVLIAFGIEQRAEIEAWLPELEPILRGRPGVRARLLVALGRGMSMMRGMIVGGLKNAVPEPHLRASTIPLFTDVDALCRSLAITDRAHVAAFVVAADGVVLWRSAGAPGAETAAAIAAALEG